METTKKPTRATLPKSALTRLYIIDQQIASGKYPNTKQLVKHLLDKWGDVSISTISRDIEFLRDQLRAPIEYDPSHRGYYYTEPNFRIPMGFSGADELLALGMVKNILTLYQNTPVYNAAHHLLESITAPMAVEGDSDWYESRIVVPQVPSAPIPPDIWEIITTALRKNHVITFEYQGAHDDEYKPRRVRPYQLLFDNGLWYLYAYAEERKDTRIFSLYRIKNIALTKATFFLPKDYDYRIGTAGSYFGVFAGQKKTRFKIAFYGYSVALVKDRKWADDQKIVDTEEGIIVTFTSTHFEKVLEWVLSRGCNALPLEPESLVAAWRDNVDGMRKMARSIIS